MMRCVTSSTVRNKDMSWPEEMSFIANSSKMDRHKGELMMHSLKQKIKDGDFLGLSEISPVCFPSRESVRF